MRTDELSDNVIDLKTIFDLQLVRTETIFHTISRDQNTLDELERAFKLTEHTWFSKLNLDFQTPYTNK